MPPLQPRDAHHAGHLSTSVALALVGGYLDAFTYVGHGHVFANAQTGNVVLLGLGLVNGSWHALRHLPPVLAFLCGIFAARGLMAPAVVERIRYLYTPVLALEVAVFFAIGLLPSGASDFWITIVISFIASIQVEVFNEVHGARYNSTFTTGNLRTLSESVFDWCAGKRTPESVSRIRDFAGICLAFLAGATAGAFFTSRWNNRALWFELVLLVPLLIRFWRCGLLREAAGPVDTHSQIF